MFDRRQVDERLGLASPDRIVVDMPEVNFQPIRWSGFLDHALPSISFVKGFRFGLLARQVSDRCRPGAPARPAEVSAKRIVEGKPAARLTIELKPRHPGLRRAGPFVRGFERKRGLRRPLPCGRSSCLILVTAA